MSDRQTLVPTTSEGVLRIAAERERQIEDEGWTPDHDALHPDRCLAQAGACYAWDYVNEQPEPDSRWLAVYWPWGEEWWKPTPGDPIRQLTKAGALIAAEIDRLVRREATL